MYNAKTLLCVLWEHHKSHFGLTHYQAYIKLQTLWLQLHIYRIFISSSHNDCMQVAIDN